MSTPLTLSERAGRAALWNVLALGMLAALAFATGVLLARWLSKEELAAYAQFVALVAGLLAVVDLGLSSSVPKFAASGAAEGGARGMLRLLRVVAGLKLSLLAVVGVLTALFADEIVSFFGTSRSFLAFVLDVAALDLLSDVLQQGLATFLAQGAVQSIRIVESVVKSGLIIALVLARVGVSRILWAFVAASSVKLVLSAICLAREVRALPPGGSLPPLAPILPRLARHSATLYATKLCSYLASADYVTAVLWAVATRQIVATFSVASGLLFGLLELATSPVNSLLLPIFANLVLRKDAEPVRRAYTVLTKVYAFALIPTAAGLAAIAPHLFQVLYTQKYLESVPYFQWMIALIFAECVLFPTAYSAMVTTERYKSVLLSRLPVIAAGVCLGPAIRAWGPLHAIAMLCGSRLVAAFLLTRMARSALGARVPAGFLLRQAILAVVLAIPLWVLTRGLQPSKPLLIGAIAAYAALYVAAFRLTGGIGRNERAAIAEMRLPLKGILRWVL